MCTIQIIGFTARLLSSKEAGAKSASGGGAFAAGDGVTTRQCVETRADQGPVATQLTAQGSNKNCR